MDSPVLLVVLVFIAMPSLLYSSGWIERLVRGPVLPKAEPGEEILELEPDPDPEPEPARVVAPTSSTRTTLASAVLAIAVVGLAIYVVWVSGKRSALEKRVQDMANSIDELDSETAHLRNDLDSLRYRISDLEH